MSIRGEGHPNRRANGSLLIVLVALMGVGPLFPFMLAASSALVIERFGVTAGQLGVIASVVFGSAALASQVSGWLADSLSVRLQLAFNFGGATLALVIAATTQTFIALVAGAVIAGASQAISNPTTNRVILEVVPRASQTSWIGVKQSGVQLAQLFSGVFFPVTALAMGWVGAALGGALLAVSLAIFGMSVVGRYYPRVSTEEVDAPNRADDVKSTRKTEVPPNGRSSSGKTKKGPPPPAVVTLAVIIFLIGFGVQTVHVYLPLFAVREMGFSLVSGGLTVTVIGVVGMAARIWWAQRVSAGGRLSTLLIVITLGAALGVVVIVLAKVTGFGALLWVAAALHGMTGLGGNVVINAGIMRAAPAGQIGRASGLNSMGMYTGFTLGPLIMGGLLDLSGSFLIGWFVMIVTFLLAAGVSIGLRRHGKIERTDS